MKTLRYKVELSKKGARGFAAQVTGPGLPWTIYAEGRTAHACVKAALKGAGDQIRTATQAEYHRMRVRR